ncbi:MAG: VPLPA-CTERM-specific exosortase XrtD [Nitrospiraceae bacterium]
MLCSIVILGFVYFDALAFMVDIWLTDDNYGHGFFVPLISGYLIWRRSFLLAAGVHPSWWGLPVLLIGMLLYFIGELTTLYVLEHVSFWLVLVALTSSTIGLSGVKQISFPLLYLLTMIPLPQFIHQSLSSQLQLISSALGVGCLQLIGVTAFREGNVIDLGPIQLQVVEACSGLRYLFPLTSLGLLCAYLFQDRMWKRVLLFLSSIPVSIVLNGLRIGIIGILVELYGTSAAEGFSHLFEGWVLFVVSLGLLFLTMWGLSRVEATGRRKTLSALISFAPNASSAPRSDVFEPHRMWSSSPSPAFICCVGLLGVMAVASTQVVSREEIRPARQAFVDFPMQVGLWQGTTLALEKVYIDVLRFDDYLLADYQAPDHNPVNFYVAYYGSQRKGQSAHSPRTCIPGGGWEITSLRNVEVTPQSPHAPHFQANRAVIQKGEQKQIVLYWFKHRERFIPNEYLVKFFLFWDALTKSRTDGALVRLVATVEPGEDESTTDRRLLDFAELASPLLARYVPD